MKRPNACMIWLTLWYNDTCMIWLTLWYNDTCMIWLTLWYNDTNQVNQTSLEDSFVVIFHYETSNYR